MNKCKKGKIKKNMENAEKDKWRQSRNVIKVERQKGVKDKIAETQKEAAAKIKISIKSKKKLQ